MLPEAAARRAGRCRLVLISTSRLAGADPQDFNAFPKLDMFAALVGALDATSRIIGNPPVPTAA